MIIVNEYFVYRAVSLTCGRYEFPEVLLGAMMHIQNIFWPLWIFANVYWTHCPEVLFIMDVSKITSTRRHKYHKTIFNIHNQGCRLQDIIRTLWVLDWIDTENLNIKALKIKIKVTKAGQILQKLKKKNRKQKSKYNCSYNKCFYIHHKTTYSS